MEVWTIMKNIGENTRELRWRFENDFRKARESAEAQILMDSNSRQKEEKGGDHNSSLSYRRR
jgi:hypothetical protein